MILFASWESVLIVTGVPLSSWYAIFRWTVEATMSSFAKKDFPRISLKALLHCIMRNKRVFVLCLVPYLIDCVKYIVAQGWVIEPLKVSKSSPLDGLGSVRLRPNDSNVSLKRTLLELLSSNNTPIMVRSTIMIAITKGRSKFEISLNFSKSKNPNLDRSIWWDFGPAFSKK